MITKNVRKYSARGLDSNKDITMQFGMCYDTVEEDLVTDKKAKRGELPEKTYTRENPLHIVQCEVPPDAVTHYRKWKERDRTKKLPRSKSRTHRATKKLVNFMIDALLNNQDIYFRIVKKIK